MKQWNWDHLRFMISLAENGTLSKSAEQLGVSHTTVQRRIQALEEELSVQLFVHTPDGYQLTAAGNLLYEKVHSLQDTVYTVSRELAAHEQSLSGVVTIVTPDTIGHLLMPEVIQQISELHPGIMLNLIVDNKLSDLARAESDIAIRTGKKIPLSLIGKKVGEFEFCLCASKRYLNRKLITEKSGDDYCESGVISTETATASPLLINSNEHQFVGLTDDYAATHFYQWFEDCVPDGATISRSDGLMSVYSLCSAGLGVAMLPKYVLTINEELIELSDSRPDKLPRNEIWMLSHAEMRDSLRIRTVKALISNHLQTQLLRA